MKEIIETVADLGSDFLIDLLPPNAGVRWVRILMLTAIGLTAVALIVATVMWLV